MPKSQFRNWRLVNCRRKAFRRQANRCYYCGVQMWLRNLNEFSSRFGLPVELADRLRCTAEHLKARCCGGTDEPSNLVAACLYCNQRRHYMPVPLEPNEYREFVRYEMAAGRWHLPQIATLVLGCPS